MFFYCLVSYLLKPDVEFLVSFLYLSHTVSSVYPSVSKVNSKIQFTWYLFYAKQLKKIPVAKVFFNEMECLTTISRICLLFSFLKTDSEISYRCMPFLALLTYANVSTMDSIINAHSSFLSCINYMLCTLYSPVKSYLSEILWMNYGRFITTLRLFHFAYTKYTWEVNVCRRKTKFKLLGIWA